MIKHVYRLENYLNSLNPEYKKIICQFRVSDHSLAIEKGRYKKIPRHLRICNQCNIIEDEYHFILDCSLNENIRKQFFEAFEYDSSIKREEMINIILNPDTKEQVRLLGSFLKQSLALRTGG